MATKSVAHAPASPQVKMENDLRSARAFADDKVQAGAWTARDADRWFAAKRKSLLHERKAADKLEAQRKAAFDHAGNVVTKRVYSPFGATPEEVEPRKPLHPRAHAIGAGNVLTMLFAISLMIFMGPSWWLATGAAATVPFTAVYGRRILRDIRPAPDSDGVVQTPLLVPVRMHVVVQRMRDQIRAFDGERRAQYMPLWTAVEEAVAVLRIDPFDEIAEKRIIDRVAAINALSIQEAKFAGKLKAEQDAIKASEAEAIVSSAKESLRNGDDDDLFIAIAAADGLREATERIEA